MPAVPHCLQLLCAWRVTTGLSPHYGADSDSVICVALGITVALANWPSLLEIYFLPLHEVEVQEKLINVAHPNGFFPRFFGAVRPPGQPAAQGPRSRLLLGSPANRGSACPARLTIATRGHRRHVLHRSPPGQAGPWDPRPPVVETFPVSRCDRSLGALGPKPSI